MNDTVRPKKQNPTSKESAFGKDHSLVHEAVVTGRKAGADSRFWSALAHDEELFRRTVEFVKRGGYELTVVPKTPGDFSWIPKVEEHFNCPLSMMHMGCLSFSDDRVAVWFYKK